MTKINPYLDFNGDAEEAMNFYKSAFGGEFAAVMRWGEMPDGEACQEMKLTENERGKIMHIALPISDGNVLMASDALESMGGKRTVGNNFSIAVSPASRAETDRLFNNLAQGGTVTMPLADVFWGDYFGMCIDKFGVQWLLSYNSESEKN